MAYADGDAPLWDDFGRFFESSNCSAIPWLVKTGNHEVETDELTAEPFTHYRHRWKTPTSGPEKVFWAAN